MLLLNNIVAASIVFLIIMAIASICSKKKTGESNRCCYLFALVLVGMLIVTIIVACMNPFALAEVGTYYEDKVVLLTGASKGIGRQLAYHLAQKGAKVVVTARSYAKLLSLADSCAEFKGEIYPLKADVSNETECEMVVDKTIERYGKIDIVILNAAISRVMTFEQMIRLPSLPSPSALFHQTININFMQAVYFTHYAIDHLKKSNGILVGVSSIAGHIPTYGSAPYSASKHALHGFLGSLRAEINNTFDVMILPLPFVITETAVNNLNPKDVNRWMTSEECAKEMAKVIPTRKWEYYLSTDTMIGVYINHFFPSFIQQLSLSHLKEHFDFMKM